MHTIGLHDTVGDIVTHNPTLARVFEDLRIDYCCGGPRPLAEACQAAGVDPDDAVRRLAAAAQGPVGAEPDVAAMSLTGLAGHIEATHHELLRRELPRLRGLTEKVASVHGEADPRLADVCDKLHLLANELESHMRKEEQILFPLIRQLDQSPAPVAFGCGSLAGPIRQMESEHDAAGDLLGDLRRLSDDYVAPEWACNTYRAMLAGLEELELDLHRHIHKENSVLFPRALAEETRRGTPA